jgi:hypothetical protein
MEVLMKYLFGVITVMVIVFLVSCGSSPSPTQTPAQTSRNHSVSGVIPDRSVNVNYTISDSSAFSFALAWVAQHMHNNDGSPITVNDSANGIIAGRYYTFDYWRSGGFGSRSVSANFRVVINNRTASLRITDISYRDGGPRNEQEARERVRDYENMVEEWLISFRRTFE